MRKPLLGLGTVAACLALAAPASASFGGRNGGLLVCDAFHRSDRDGGGEEYTEVAAVSTNGSGYRALFRVPSNSCPDLSISRPGGALASDTADLQQGRGPPRLTLGRLAGGPFSPLRQLSAADSAPVFGPDGRLAFIGRESRGGRLVSVLLVVRRNGSGLKRLFTGSGRNVGPVRWLRGGQIVFARGGTILGVRPDGHRLRALARRTRMDDLSVSGRSVAFANDGETDGRRSGVFVKRLGRGGRTRRIT